MKKFFALFAALVLVGSTVFASEDLDNSGPWNPDAVENSMNYPVGHDNDYSFDFATGEYKIFVICELTVVNNCGNIYLGWLNPDGSKILGDGYDMTFKVQGGNGWKFEANGSFGEDPGSFSTDAVAYSYNETAGAQTNNVFITGSQWYYNGNAVQSGNQFNDYVGTLSGTMYQFGSVTVAPGATYGGEEYDITAETNLDDNASIVKLWKIGDGQCSSCPEGSNACQGTGEFKLTPGTVWASPDATEGFYTFPVYIDVDYLTFDNEDFYADYKTTDVNGDPSNYVFGNAGLPTP